MEWMRRRAGLDDETQRQTIGPRFSVLGLFPPSLRKRLEKYQSFFHSLLYYSIISKDSCGRLASLASGLCLVSLPSHQSHCTSHQVRARSHSKVIEDGDY
jgi:hypothetical protein